MNLYTLLLIYIVAIKSLYFKSVLYVSSYKFKNNITDSSHDHHTRFESNVNLKCPAMSSSVEIKLCLFSKTINICTF